MTRTVLSGLLIAVWSCGSVQKASDADAGAGTGDAGPMGSAGTDAMTDAGGSDPVGNLDVATETRFAIAAGPGQGSVLGGVDVVSLGPDGKTLVDMAQSDSEGKARLKARAGGSVTAIYRHAEDGGADLVTYFGVKPDDRLRFGQRYAPSASNSLGSMLFMYPAVDGAALYQVFGPCGSELAGAGKLAVSLVERASCHHEPMDVVYVALDAQGQVLGYNYASVPFQAGASASIASWTMPRTASLNMLGLPPEVRSVNAILFNVGNADQQMYNFLVAGQATGGAYSISFPWATAAVHTEARLIMARSGTFAPVQLLDLLQPDTTSWTVASPTLPPWLQSWTASTANRTASISLTGDGSYDAAIFQIIWQHDAASGAVRSLWRFVLPPGMTSFAFPALPAPFSALMPRPDDAYTTEAHLVEIPSLAGYDELRAVPESSLICPDSLVPDCALRSGEFQRIVFE